MQLAFALDISIHALRVEGDRPRRFWASRPWYFYPRPPCGGRRLVAVPVAVAVRISIHALRVEGDHLNINIIPTTITFLSTPSVWRATRRRLHTAFTTRYFYPRPPCGGRHNVRFLIISERHFYPRPPCGGRRLDHIQRNKKIKFLSTPSVWRATALDR